MGLYIIWESNGWFTIQSDTLPSHERTVMEFISHRIIVKVRNKLYSLVCLCSFPLIYCEVALFFQVAILPGNKTLKQNFIFARTFYDIVMKFSCHLHDILVVQYETLKKSPKQHCSVLFSFGAEFCRKNA